MKIKIIKGDILTAKVDAIVNAANENLIGGSGVCGAIFTAAGWNKLQAECDKIGYCDTGKAVATPGCNLNVKCIIHAVGPRYKNDTISAPLLRDTYINSLKVAEANGCASIAFPAISTGIFRYPLDKATKIAIDALLQYKGTIQECLLYCFDQETYDVYMSIFNSAIKDNKEIKKNYKEINRRVMTDTYKMCKENDKLINSIKYSINNQFIVYEQDNIEISYKANPRQEVIVSKKRSYEAASAYKYSKIAVLNFANNHSIGGAPYSAGAQEESLCRCSTLLPCLEEYKKEYYEYHQNLYAKGLLDNLGNDDIIYTPNVTVFKTDESEPKLLDEKDWYKVDIITCAAPEVKYGFDKNKLQDILTNRIKKILDVAEVNRVKVLILGAFGCGAFGNPPEMVADIFKKLLQSYSFEIVEFAVFTKEDTTNYDVFKGCFCHKITNVSNSIATIDVENIIQILSKENRTMTLNEIYHAYESNFDISGLVDFKSAIRTCIYRHCIDRDLNTKGEYIFYSEDLKRTKGNKYGLYSWKHQKNSR